MAGVLQPAFIAGTAGPLFICRFCPDKPTDSWLIFVPPFAEEANKSRRMISRLGYALAEQGVGMCLIDPYGTGDSGGDFADASIAQWQSDIATVASWLKAESGASLLSLGGLRLGALIAVQSAREMGEIDRLVLWQPVVRGSQQLTQFLRLKQAGAVMGGAQTSLQSLRETLAAGQALEVAGYELSPRLAAELEQMQFQPSSAPHCGTAWIELVRGDGNALSPASRTVVTGWQDAGCEVDVRLVRGDSFWGVQELVDAPAFVEATVSIFREGALA